MILTCVCFYKDISAYCVLFLPLGNAAPDTDTIEVTTDRNRQTTVLVPLNELSAFFVVCRPGRRGKLLRRRIYHIVCCCCCFRMLVPDKIGVDKFKQSQKAFRSKAGKKNNSILVF